MMDTLCWTECRRPYCRLESYYIETAPWFKGVVYIESASSGLKEWYVLSSLDCRWFDDGYLSTRIVLSEDNNIVKINGDVVEAIAELKG